MNAILVWSEYTDGISVTLGEDPLLNHKYQLQYNHIHHSRKQLIVVTFFS